MFGVARVAARWRDKDKPKEKEKESPAVQEEVIKLDETMAWKFLSADQINTLLEQDIAGVQNFFSLCVCVCVEAQHMTLVENIEELRRTMAGIGLCRPEKSGGFDFFTIDQAKAIVGYLEISFFQHYALYEYLFHSPREELVIGDENVVELVKPADAPFPAPLEEGLACDIHSTFIALMPAAEDVVEETEGGIQPEEQPEGETAVDPLTGYCMDDIKSVLGEVTTEVMSNLQTEINEKLQMQEEAYSLRIEKLKKA
ncbi:ciliary-associated calcium-binding coiled-coil protein 1 isoform X5 [Paroedura picta]|uniref:ciliary-associated calcium-binding coiled-coil protein 1 isoform X5 n=1 Tax=Paroedura picta TaxID=143630 RepID=UPI0040567857